ncbi:MAG: DUF1573 domain-containing protein [Candidatus Cloacimonetes bacterium]|nr:DUF1573 domain-containing protein [Candidatus Cloacimonadota bacterium]MBS3768235.1 DUF1573 domain-containing protein [Candidatus Cloacimonadota bacterium]
MRKSVIILLFAIFIVSFLSAEPQISLKEETYDFGEIKEKDGRVSHKFVFTNTGDDSLIVKRVSSS